MDGTLHNKTNGPITLNIEGRVTQRGFHQLFVEEPVPNSCDFFVACMEVGRPETSPSLHDTSCEWHVSSCEVDFGPVEHDEDDDTRIGWVCQRSSGPQGWSDGARPLGKNLGPGLPLETAKWVKPKTEVVTIKTR